MYPEIFRRGAADTDFYNAHLMDSLPVLPQSPMQSRSASPSRTRGDSTGRTDRSLERRGRVRDTSVAAPGARARGQSVDEDGQTDEYVAAIASDNAAARGGGPNVQNVVNNARVPMRGSRVMGLTDAHIDPAMRMISEIVKQPYLAARTASNNLGCYGRVPADVVNAIQVVQIRNEQWIAMRRYGGRVEIANSSRWACLDRESETRAAELFGDKLAARIVDGPKQYNDYDSGVIAIACALDWALAPNEQNGLQFDTDSHIMRTFLQKCLNEGAFRQPFPRARRTGADMRPAFCALVGRTNGAACGR